MDVLPLYERHAHDFDRLRRRDLIERPYLDAAIADLGPSPSVLDVGCGTGEPIARYLIERGCYVTGIDGAARMIALAEKKFPAAEWLNADMRSFALGRQFDALVAWDSFFHLPAAAQGGVLARFGRHVRAGGALCFTSGPRAGEAIGDLVGKPLYHASLDPPEYERLLDAAGFRVTSFHPEDVQCGGHTVWLATKVR